MQRLEKKEPDAGGLLGASCTRPEETSKKNPETKTESDRWI
jgi:hypothetical protein